MAGKPNAAEPTGAMQAPLFTGIKRVPTFSSNSWVHDWRQDGNTLTFDDVPGDTASMMNGYGNLRYTNINSYDLDFLSALHPGSGYVRAATGTGALFALSQQLASFSTGGADFHFNSVDLASARRDGMTIQVRGYDDGALVLSRDVTVGIDKTNFVFDWSGIDTVSFYGTGGTVTPNQTGSGYQIVIDNLRTSGVGAVAGLAFDDVNRNGTRDDGEVAIVDRIVYADVDGDGVRDADEPFATSGSDGTYRLEGLAAGTYLMRQDLPRNRIDTNQPTVVLDGYGDPEWRPSTFVDIAATGTKLAFAEPDDGFVAQSLGQQLAFYGQSFGAIRVSINGMLDLVTSNAIASSSANTALPNVTWKGVIAPFWDDLVLGADGAVYFQDDAANGRFIVQWSNVEPYSDANNPSSGIATFQAVIGYDGQIEYNYGTVSGTFTATIGVSDPTGTLGTYRYGDLPDNVGITLPIDPTVASPYLVEVDADTTVTGIDMASSHVGDDGGRVTGTLFVDSNENGVFDKGERAKAGWTVFLDANDNGLHDIGEQTTTTDKAGAYTLRVDQGGTYAVVATAPLTWERFTFAGEETSERQSSPVDDVMAGRRADPLTPREALAAVVAASDHDAPATKYVHADFDAPHVEGQLVVRAVAGADTDAVAAAMARVGATLVDETVAIGIQVWAVPGDIEATADVLGATGLFRYVEPNYLIEAPAAVAAPITNDSAIGTLWAADDMNLDAAWHYSTGSDAVVVGVIDTGIDLDHPDLRDNLWTNPGEIAGNGFDDDDNGYVDDVYGWNFQGNNNDVDDKTYGHGSHVAGTIAAVGNNGIGISGVVQDAQLMTVRIYNGSPSGVQYSTAANVVKAIEYATMMKADVVNASWGGSTYSQALSDVVKLAPLFVASAGNSTRDNDVAPAYPSGYTHDNIIAVAAANDQGTLSSFTQWGKTSVDLAAPGVQIYSTLPLELGGYAYYDGTSMAAPNVTGAAALLLSIDPTLTDAQVKHALLAGAHQTGELGDKTVSGGKLDILAAINNIHYESKTVTLADGENKTLDFAVTGGATTGSDVVFGFAMDETIAGLGGGDSLAGRGGDDRLSGGDGDDFLGGDAGDDVLIGGAGGDRMEGGDGADTFVLRRHDGIDSIADFDFAEGDRIQIIDNKVTSFGKLRITQPFETLVGVTFGQTTVYFNGDKDDLTPDMFIFGRNAFAQSSPHDLAMMNYGSHGLVGVPYFEVIA